MTSEGLIRTIARCALDLAPADRLRVTLEENLFTVLLNDVHDGVVTGVVGDAILQLYSDLEDGMDARASARRAFNKMRSNPAAIVCCPIEAVIAGLEDAAASGQITYSEAQKLASLPWSALSTSVDTAQYISANNFRIGVEAILHEVEEGFVDPKTTYPEHGRSAAALLLQLRLEASRLQSPR